MECVILIWSKAAETQDKRQNPGAGYAFLSADRMWGTGSNPNSFF